MDILKNNLKGALRPTLMVALLGFGTAALATPPVVGQLVIINGLANVVNGSTGGTASAVKVVVNDASGPCSTTASVAYRGTVTVSWNASATHSATSCTDITSVDVTPLKTTTTVQYDSTANATPPAVATAATNFVAPTTGITSLTLIVTGSASAASTSSATAWGSALGVKPVYDTNNGALTTTGVMGSVGAAGFKAENMMRRYGIIPINSGSNYVAR